MGYRGIFDGKQLRAYYVEDEAWFVAIDAIRCLGLNDAGGSARHLGNLKEKEMRVVSKGDLGFSDLFNGPGGQKVVVINESGLYRLIMRSNKESAKKFQDWIVQDVLPSIRKTGSYVMPEVKEVARVCLSKGINIDDQLEKLRSIPGYISVGKSIAKEMGTQLNQTTLNQFVKAMTGLDVLELFGVAKSECSDYFYTVSDLAEYVTRTSGKSFTPYDINMALRDLGLQVLGNGNVWIPTEDGVKYSKVECSHQGRQVVRWSREVIDVIN